MKKVKQIIFLIFIMLVMSFICLGILSVLTYEYKWQADKALVGITLTYILVGFIGGMLQRIMNKETKTMGGKMREAILLSAIFLAILVGISTVFLQTPFAISSRFFMICILLTGSTCLGRVMVNV